MRGSNRYLPPWVLQVIGLLLLFVFAGYWILTNRESTLLVTTAVALIGLGGYQQAGQALNKLIERDRRE